MSKVVQVRNVPDEVHAILTHRAAAAGMSLSDYALRELEVAAARNANQALLMELATLPYSAVSGADIVRAERSDRDSELSRRAAGP